MVGSWVVVGGNSKLPKECEYCGTSVKADDIFERMKGLLASIDSSEARK